MYDPKTGKITLISTCFPTHHLMFAEDANNTLWTSAGGPQSGVVGWLNRKMFEETGDEAKSQGWTPIILDTNGNGKRDELRRAEPAGRSDQGQAHRRRASTASASTRSTARSGASVLAFPGSVVRVESGRQSAGDGARRSLRAAAAGLRRRAAATSTATASSGCRSRAATWRASIAASARVRSTARPRPASTAPRAGRSIRSPARSSRT